MRLHAGPGVGIGAFCLLLWSTAAVAQPVAPPEGAQDVGADTDREARFLFEAGRTAYDAGRYREALGHFQRAHELSGRPQLLYNVGQAADRLREDELALDAFERYIAALPDAPNRVAVEERIKVLREVLAEKQAAKEAAAQSATSPSEVALAATATGPDLTEPPRDEDESLLSKWWLWAAAGGVVAGVVVGVLIATSGGDGGGTTGMLVEGSDGSVIVALELP